MPEYTSNYSLLKLNPGEAFGVDGYAFVQSNRDLIDRLLKIGAETHHHDGAAAAFISPTAGPGLTLSNTGGYIPAGTRVYYKFTLVDAYGNETAGSPESYVDTAAAITTPLAPALTLATTGGTLTAGNYYYALSAYKGVDSQETKALNPAYITVSTGVSTGKVTLTMPTPPTGADGFNIYRKKPGATEYRWLTSVTSATTTFNDTGSVTEDASRTLPTANTTNSASSITVQIGPNVEGLTAAQSGFESGVGGWTGLTNATVAQSASAAYAGSNSLAITASSSATMRAVSPTGTSGVAVSVGDTVSGSFWIRPGGTARNVSAVLRWYNSGGSFLSENVSSTVLETSGVFVQVTATAVAPASAAFVSLAAEIVTPANAEVHYLDSASILKSNIPVGATWKLYRTYTTGDYTNSLLQWIQTTDKTFVDTGTATTAGQPPNQSQIVGSPPKINLATDVTGTLSTSNLPNTTKLLGLWIQDDVPISQTNVTLNLYGDTTRSAIPMLRAGSVTGIVVKSNAARTAGTLTVEVTKNGAGTGFTAILNATNTTSKATTQAVGTTTFVAGDDIGVRITTDGTWAPTTADISVEVEVAQASL